MATENCVAKLNEFAQRTRSLLIFEDVGAVGPDHIRTFTVRAVLNGKVYPDGVGKNKKEAKQNAAKNALRGLLEEPSDFVRLMYRFMYLLHVSIFVFYSIEDKLTSHVSLIRLLFSRQTENVAETATSTVLQTSISNTNYICWLNEYGQKNRLTIRAVESTRLGPSNAIQCCSFVVGDKEYPAVSGNTRREAKEEAAKLVHDVIHGSKTIETEDEKCSATSNQQREDLKQNVSEICDKTKDLSVKTEGGSFSETNFIGIVNHYCQKTKRSHDYILERRCGPSHSPQFFYKLVINDKEYPVAEGKSIKEAKQNAAQLAWSALQEQSDWDSKITFWSAVSDDGGPAKPPTLPSTPESRDAQSKGIPPITSDSAVFTSPSNLLKDKDQRKDQSPDVKPKIRLAANFPNARKHSKEEIVNFSGKNAGNSLSEKTTTQSVISRFTSEFDSIERLGKGAFGRVFKAKQKLLGKFYAVKIVRCKEKALREVGALSDLHHCNIVRYFTCWMEDSEYQWDDTADSGSTSQSTSNSSAKFLYIQMELCDLRTLRVWIDERNIQNVKKSRRDSKRREDSLTIAQQIVCGVDYIHSRMFIHRDLKPANIMFGRGGEVKIGDFGLVTAENDDDAENVMERSVYKGTPSYMAPEQKSKSTYDRKVDIFALGLIYFELLWNLSTGHERKVIWDDARSQKLPQGFSHNFPKENQIIKSMLHVKPEERPEASKLKSDLEEYGHVLHELKNMQRDSKSV
ncbi:interferon-induced, double-stranded RNA-activated protein kinase isoform X1 [Seriola aureovittata]|uniref:interferon-induced, double-stranded RNA-activated protein kinase isoform X1 n=1 Tax=Seriola aureovittata TaxID=2871759 RepID=UPI0024BE7EB8|nr:interferon-induced, double-stranded RNA-activated protein kinase isoform X1 [Seriola aureovittata]